MRLRIVAYFAAILLAGAGLAIAALVYPDSSDVLVLAGQAMLAVLTFPLGVVATAAGVYGVHSGVVTHAEALLFTAPLHAVLGYVQWWKLVPRFHASRS